MGMIEKGNVATVKKVEDDRIFLSSCKKSFPSKIFQPVKVVDYFSIRYETGLEEKPTRSVLVPVAQVQKAEEKREDEISEKDIVSFPLKYCNINKPKEHLITRCWGKDGNRIQTVEGTVVKCDGEEVLIKYSCIDPNDRFKHPEAEVWVNIHDNVAILVKGDITTNE